MQWYARRLSKNGAVLSGDVRLRPGSGSVSVGSAFPVGTLPDGSLVVDIELQDPQGTQRLARVNPDGSTVVTRSKHGQPFVDRDGLVHILSSGALVHTIDYTQVDMTKKGLPTIRSLAYGQPFGSLSSAPEYLRWWAGYRGRPIEGALFSDGPGRLLVVTSKGEPADTICHLYRVVTKTLALIDSGQMNLTRDIYHTWTGPTIGWATIVPADGGGYWLFEPTGAVAPAPTVIAYRLRPDLTAVHPAAVTSLAAEPFANAPKGAVVSIMGIPASVRLEFTALGSDGRLYQVALEDSLVSYGTK